MPSDAVTRFARLCALSGDATPRRCEQRTQYGPVSSAPHGVSRSRKNFVALRILRLAEPEHGLLANLGVAVVLRDVHQLVERFVVVPLRHDKREVLAQRVRRRGRSYKREQVRASRIALAEPEQRLLARLERRVLIATSSRKSGEMSKPSANAAALSASSALRPPTWCASGDEIASPLPSRRPRRGRSGRVARTGRRSESHADRLPSARANRDDDGTVQHGPYPSGCRRSRSSAAAVRRRTDLGARREAHSYHTITHGRNTVSRRLGRARGGGHRSGRRQQQCVISFVDQVAQELFDARVVLLTEPEERLSSAARCSDRSSRLSISLSTAAGSRRASR